jgi:hypothetical protein
MFAPKAGIATFSSLDRGFEGMIRSRYRFPQSGRLRLSWDHASIKNGG